MELIPASFMFLNGRMSTSVLFKILALSSAFNFNLMSGHLLKVSLERLSHGMEGEYYHK